MSYRLPIYPNLLLPDQRFLILIPFCPFFNFILFSVFFGVVDKGGFLSAFKCMLK